jgi:hypothetical protein
MLSEARGSAAIPCVQARASAIEMGWLRRQSPACEGDSRVASFLSSPGRHAGPVSLLPECPPRLIRERFEKKGQHRALVGPNESLDRHAGHQLEPVETRDLVRRYADAHEKIGLARTLILHDVSGDATDPTIEFGRGALAEIR